MKTIIFQNIPVDIFNKFKSKCASKGITMKEAFINFMKEFIK